MFVQRTLFTPMRPTRVDGLHGQLAQTCEHLDDIVLEMRLDSRSAVIALTHDPKLDDLALMEALRTPAFYAGALGSRRNNAARRERLKAFDLDASQPARLSGLAGPHVDSRTPPEIGISILTEVTAAKNGVWIPQEMYIAQAKPSRELSLAAACVV
ncbi:xdhC Rossmann domain protein [Burkholderia pseudomallei]|nr:xdhC Rossmann domain protein [Burkholderia pseudomallei]